MPWLFEGNAAHLTQYGFQVLDPLPTAVDPWGGVWTTSTTTVLSSWEVPSTSGGFPFGGWSSSGLSLQFAWVFDIGGGTVSGSLDNLTADGGHQGTSSLWPDTAPSPPPPNDLDSPLGGSSPAALTTADWISALRQRASRLETPSAATGGLGMGTGWGADTFGPLPARRTSVPRCYNEPCTWSYEQIVRYNMFGKATLGTTSAEFYVAFKDPTVIRVPTLVGPGGPTWLMFVTRLRVPTSKVGDATLASGKSGASESLSDIVVFRSNNINFLHGVDGNIVEGPYLIADSLASVKEDQAFRTSNQVPCAVFDGDGDSPDLFVYYVVESSVRSKDVGVVPFDSVTPAQVLKRLDDWADGDYAANGRGIAVKKITFEDLRSQVLLVSPTTQETWTQASAVTGELLGLVRIWIPRKTLGVPRAVTSWDWVFENKDFVLGVNYTPVKVDPFALWLQDGGIRLFFACFERNTMEIDGDHVLPVNGWGIWHAAAIDDGIHLRDSSYGHTPTWVTTIHGKDFVVRSQEVGGVWPDMLVPGDSSAADPKKPMDPDVFQLPNGDWVMFAGCVRYWRALSTDPWENYLGNPLGRYLGDPSDLSWTWSSAF